MVITVAFKKEFNIGKGKFVDWSLTKLVQYMTKSEYVHCEVIIKDKWISSGNPMGTGVSINDLRPLSNKWEYVDIDVDGRKTSKVMKFIESQLQTKYDYTGAIFGGAFDSNVEDKNKWFCSELTAEILKQYGVEEIVMNSNMYSPGDVHYALKEINA